MLPTVLTLGNVVCGFGALTFAAKVGIEKTGWGGDDVGCQALLDQALADCPQDAAAQREKLYAGWKKAVARSLDWES